MCMDDIEARGKRPLLAKIKRTGWWYKILQIIENLSSHKSRFISDLVWMRAVDRSYPRPLAGRLFYRIRLWCLTYSHKDATVQFGTMEQSIKRARGQVPVWKLFVQPPSPLQWRHNERDSVSNQQPHDCLLNCLFRRWSKKTLKLRVTGLCVGNSPGTGEFPVQVASNAENVSIWFWWRHHAESGLSHIPKEVIHCIKKILLYCVTYHPSQNKSICWYPHLVISLSRW